MERQYPPFGEIPGMVSGNHQVLIRNEKAVAQVAGFFALPTGLLATIRTAATSDLMGARFSFERLNDPPEAGDL